jgi:hypothetical protein
VDNDIATGRWKNDQTVGSVITALQDSAMKCVMQLEENWQKI